MKDLKNGLPSRYLKAGELYVSEQPTVLLTVLGSCLTVTMFHPQSRIGGMCHGLFPTCSDAVCAGDCAEGARYVDCAIRRMAHWFDARGIPRRQIEVKCFGGADLFNAVRRLRHSSRLSVGRQNIQSAERVLAQEGFRLKVKDVGGSQGRKIYFYSHTGKVLLRRLQRAAEYEPLALGSGTHESKNPGPDRR